MQSENAKDKINNVIETTLKNINSIVDVNTTIGKPIKVSENEYVFPISKVTIATLIGGGEYGKLGLFKKNDNLPYSAGNGAIVSIKPSGFLVKNNSVYSIVSVADSSLEKLIEQTSSFIAKLKGIDD